MEAAGVPSGENGLLRASLPPPPPPPLPPPPRLLAPPGSLPSCHAARHSMKKLKWDTIPSQRVLGKSNVWTSRLPQRDLVLDISSMDKLFSRVDKWTLLQRSRLAGIKEHGGVEVGPQEPQVTILHSKRSMNIGIFLRQFKRPVAEMVEDIRQGNWCKFGSGKLKELCKMLPEESEVRQLLSFSGNLSLLPEADRFMVQLVQVPCYEELLKMMVLREEFLPLMAEVKNSLAVMIRAANELLDCDDLHAVIHLVLKAGNYMNAGGYNADAMGFRMTSLLNLADTKANTPGMNLMHYVAKQAEDIDAALLTFPGQMEHIAMALRICKEEVVADFEREVKKLKEVKLYTIRHPALFQQMETFFTQAEAQLSDVDFLLHELNVLSYAVAEYFCEDPTSFKLEECCSVFHSFCRNFDRAVQVWRSPLSGERRARGGRAAAQEEGEQPPGDQAPLQSLRSRIGSQLGVCLAQLPGQRPGRCLPVQEDLGAGGPPSVRRQTRARLSGESGEGTSGCGESVRRRKTRRRSDGQSGYPSYTSAKNQGLLLCQKWRRGLSVDHLESSDLLPETRSAAQNLRVRRGRRRVGKRRRSAKSQSPVPLRVPP
ncbi:FH2 domain-containing protein 1-like isoform X3 [Entelurus aequoreus]|uniref:FH2 domain-containing protein 1-like isoform X3 n=1 Tax=Entelurus aequoreus TaxID=161455 RepID=UPI002B1D0605|nr:FH2 domain-containing protein 1-like isoform X3 [Entelurus aequoreus]